MIVFFHFICFYLSDGTPLLFDFDFDSLMKLNNKVKNLFWHATFM